MCLLAIVSAILISFFESPQRAIISLSFVPILLLTNFLIYTGKIKPAFTYFVFSQLITISAIIFLVHPHFGLNYYYLIIPILVYIFFEDRPFLRTATLVLSVVLFLSSQYIYLNYTPIIVTKNTTLIQNLNFVSFFVIACFLLRFYITEINTYRNKIDVIFNELNAKNTNLQNFNRVAAHDLKEPLNTIIGFAGLVEMRLAKSKIKKDLEVEALLHIKDASNRMKQLLDDLTAYSLSEYTIKYEEKVNLNEILIDVQKNLHSAVKKSKAKVTVKNLPIIYANKNFLIQLFQNLIANAIKFQPKCVNNKVKQIPKIEITGITKNNITEIYVTDNGIGIPKNKLQTIFEPFRKLNSKVKYAGTGLGLTTCKNIIKQFGGKIRVMSELGKGTTFIISFPNSQ